MRCRVQRQREATAAAPAERAPQRTRAAGEGGAAKPGRVLTSVLARAEIACGERAVNVHNEPKAEAQRTAASRASRAARTTLEQPG